MVKLYKLIYYSGWTAVILFIISAYFIIANANVRLHRDFAIAAFVFVLIHISLALYPKLKRRRPLKTIVIALAVTALFATGAYCLIISWHFLAIE
ncbi:MAG: hypothetical protein V1927_06940 [Candidatus Omnitrophota bacterium]